MNHHMEFLSNNKKVIHQELFAICLADMDQAKEDLEERGKSAEYLRIYFPFTHKEMLEYSFREYSEAEAPKFDNFYRFDFSMHWLRFMHKLGLYDILETWPQFNENGIYFDINLDFSRRHILFFLNFMRLNYEGMIIRDTALGLEHNFPASPRLAIILAMCGELFEKDNQFVFQVGHSCKIRRNFLNRNHTFVFDRVPKKVNLNWEEFVHYLFKSDDSYRISDVSENKLIHPEFETFSFGHDLHENTLYSHNRKIEGWKNINRMINEIEIKNSQR